MPHKELEDLMSFLLGLGFAVVQIMSMSPSPLEWQCLYCGQIVKYITYFCFVLFFKMYFLCEYIVAVYRHTRRGCQIPLQMVVSHHVVALRTSGRAISALNR